jgi:hypothetical protein
MKLPAYTEIHDPKIKSLIYIHDMFQYGWRLKDIKTQAEMKGFNSIAKAKTFKAAFAAVTQELKNSGLITV